MAPADPPLTRRELLARIFRRGSSPPAVEVGDAVPAPRIRPASQVVPRGELSAVDRFRDLLRLRAASIPGGLPESSLPEPADALREAIVAEAARDDGAPRRDALRHAYARLAWVCGDDEVGGLDVESRTAEQARLEREFDERLAAARRS